MHLNLMASELYCIAISKSFCYPKLKMGGAGCAIICNNFVKCLSTVLIGA